MSETIKQLIFNDVHIHVRLQVLVNTNISSKNKTINRAD